MSKQHAERKPTKAKFRAVFGTDDGKAVMRWLMVRNHVFTETPDNDPRNEGRRAPILEIMDMLMDEVDPDRFVKEKHTAYTEARHDPLREDD